MADVDGKKSIQIFMTSPLFNIQHEAGYIPFDAFPILTRFV